MRKVMAAVVMAVVAGCGSGDDQTTRTEGTRDSAIAESTVPGAAGVRRALEVSDSANARRALEDSIMHTGGP